ncbi:MAG: PA2169 family four-helix-bundle protein [Phycisphaera sp.]|nr:MAG: PA2169 family four-helix-bundle protein [Phycisphaera sp.]
MESITNLDKNTLSGVKSIIEINIDASKGFETAAENIENSDIAGYFRQCSARRAQFADQLSRVVDVNGVDSPDSGTAKGAIHRWWVNIRGTVQNGDEHAVLAEAERGEDAIKGKYEEVLKSTAGSPLNAMLTDQYAAVKETHDTIRDMRDARA